MDKSLIYRNGDQAEGCYPMSWSFYGCWSVGVPGFTDTSDQTYGFDSVILLAGTPNVDYQIWLEILDLPPVDFRLKMEDGTILAEVGDRYNLSARNEHHVHITYRAYVPETPPPTDPYWVTFRLVDDFGQYEASEPFVCVFNAPAPAVEETTPPYRGRLANIYSAPMTFTFHRAIIVEGGPPVTITDEETQSQDYYSGHFDYEVSGDGMTLMLNRTGSMLPDKTWLRVSLTEQVQDADLADRLAVPFTQFVRTPALGDVDGDDDVDLSDFGIFAMCYGSLVGEPLPGCSPEEAAASDIDGNGRVNLSDFGWFALYYGG